MKVLAVEDEKEVGELLRTELEVEGLTVRVLDSGDGISQHLEEFVPDIVLLDQILPGKKGWEVINEIRANTRFAEIPIIMVTGLVGEDDQIRALDRGADDYVTKPFRVRELAARIRAVHRRVTGNMKTVQQQLVSGDLKIQFDAHRVFLGQAEVSLTVTEFNILGELIKHSGQVVTREHLREVALNNLNVTDRTIDVHMASLRKKLCHRGESIETVRGVGYRFAA